MSRILFRSAVVLAAALSLLMVVSVAYGATFSTGPGVFVSASDEEWVNRDPEKALWRAVSFTVAEDGTFSASTRVNTTKKAPANKMVSVITYDLTLSGTYEAAGGMFSGTFTINRESNTTKSGTKFEQEEAGSFSGTFKGGATSDDEITLTFDGTNAYKTKTTSSNGKVEEDDNSYALQHVVRFPVSGTLPAAPAAPSEEAPDSGVAFSDISGQVEVLIPTGYDDAGEPTYDIEAWTIAKLDMKLPVGTRIKTDTDSAVILSFADMGTFQMKPESDIILPDPRHKESPLKILAGSLWVNMKKLATGQSIDYEGSQAVAGIKGTTFVIEETGSKTTLKVLEGSVEFSPKSGGDPVLVDTGATVSADANGADEMTPFDVALEQASWDELGVTDAGGGAEGSKDGGPSRSVLIGIGIGVGSVLLGVVAFLILRRTDEKT